MAADKMPRNRLDAVRSRTEQDTMTEDITRIVNYLNAKRTGTSERTTDLAQELVHRREEISTAAGWAANRDLAVRLSDLVETLPKALPGALPRKLPRTLPRALSRALPQTLDETLPQRLPETIPETLPKTQHELDSMPNPRHALTSSHVNPALSERYHTFCHDLDIMLESFRGRLAGNKPVQH